MPMHCAERREELIELFEEPVPESYKAGRLVLQSILGRYDIPLDKPVLCVASNPLLTVCVSHRVGDKAEVGHGR
jgi:hypothetical protein